VVVRRLFGDYQESPGKYKFVADLDAFVLGVNAGLAGGSLKLGVVRRADGAIIEVANVRSGLKDSDIAAVREMLDQGKRPVFTVTFLRPNTVGVLLQEPRSSMTLLRSDKEAAECTDEQYEPEKADLIAQAQPVPGITL
jgi:ATP-dependent DNA ligase